MQNTLELTPEAIASARRHRDIGDELERLGPGGSWTINDVDEAIRRVSDPGRTNLRRRDFGDFLEGWLTGHDIAERLDGLHRFQNRAPDRRRPDQGGIERDINTLNAFIREARDGRATRTPDGIAEAMNLRPFDVNAAASEHPELWRACIHEAGHCVAGLTRGYRVASGIARSNGSGLVTFESVPPASVYAAGLAAEEYFGVNNPDSYTYWNSSSASSDGVKFYAATAGDAEAEDRALRGADALDPMALLGVAKLLYLNHDCDVPAYAIEHVFKWFTDETYMRDQRDDLANARAYAKALERDAERA